MIYIPRGYVLLERNKTAVVVKDSFREPLLAQGIADPAVLSAAFEDAGEGHTGRGTLLRIPITGRSGETMVIRKYLRGGMLRLVNRDLYWGRNRPFEELMVTTRAAVRGISVPEMLAAVSIHVAGSFFHGYLISRELSLCLDLPAYINSICDKGEEAFCTGKREVLAQVAEAVRTMHDTGFVHGDLNMKNIMVDAGDALRVYIIDWDKSRHDENLGQQERSANVVRFCRSMAKFERKGLAVSPDDQLYFMEQYWNDSKQAAADFRCLKRTLILRNIFWSLTRQV